MKFSLHSIKHILCVIFIFLVLIYLLIIRQDNQKPVVERYEIKFKDYKHNYRFEIESPHCADTETVLIAIALQPEDVDLRKEIRKTWVHNISTDVTYRFFIGNIANDTVMNECFSEARIYNDIVIISIYDSRVSSIDKVYSILNWQQRFCSAAKYLLKTQDNTVTSIPRLLYWIDNEFNNAYIATDGKIIFCRTLHYISKDMTFKIKWSNESGVEFCEKFTYLMSTRAVKLILSQTVNENLTTIFEELMFTGILAERLEIERIHSPKYFAHAPFKADCGCNDEGVPFLISKQDDSESEITFLPHYLDFMNASCPNNSSQRTAEYFASCVAHSG